MNFQKFKALAKLVILPIPIPDDIVWEDNEELFINLIPYVEPKFWEEHYIGLPNDMDRANFFSFRNCVYTQLRNYQYHGKSFWDE